VGGVTTLYQYDGTQVLTEVTGTSGSVYLWGPGGLVLRNGEWPTTDGLGNTRLVTNGSQSVTNTQVPDAYGEQNYSQRTGTLGRAHSLLNPRTHDADCSARKETP